jgi:hypothetical protein
MVCMDVELLLVPDCPHSAPAAVLLRDALADVGLTAQEFRTSVISDQSQAERRGFVGSPTFLIDGVDPFAEDGQPPAVACRVYRTEAGPAGTPTLPQLRAVLRRAKDQSDIGPQ